MDPERTGAGAAAGLRRRADRAVIAAAGLWCWLRHPGLILFLLKRSRPRGRRPRPGLPVTADDKFLWRKIFDHDPRFPALSDKVAVKDWVAQAAPDLEVARLLWAGTDPAAIPEGLLRPGVAVKANHGCAMNRLLRAEPVDRAALETEARRWLARDYARTRGQWGYRDIPRKILVEELLPDDGDSLQELKFYTFGREIPLVVQIVGRFGRMRARYLVPAPGGGFEALDTPTEVAPVLYEGGPPPSFDRACRIAADLGAAFDHVRVDLLTDGTRIWLGELTFYNLGGRITDEGADPDAPMSRAWDIRRAAFLRDPPRRGWRAIYARALRRELDRRAAAEKRPRELDPPPPLR